MRPYSRHVPVPITGQMARNNGYCCDLWIPQIVQAYWQTRIMNFTHGDLEDEHFAPLYDAAGNYAESAYSGPANLPRPVRRWAAAFFPATGSVSLGSAARGSGNRARWPI